MLAVDPDSRLQAVTVLRRSAFHYEFAFKDSPAVYESYRVHGVSFCHLDPAWIPNIEFSFGSSYILTHRLKVRKPPFLNRIESLVADFAEGFKFVPGPLNGYLGSYHSPTLWRRRPTGGHLIASRDTNVIHLKLESGLLARITHSMETEGPPVAFSYDGSRIFYVLSEDDSIHVSDVLPQYFTKYGDKIYRWDSQLIGVCRGRILGGGFHHNNFLLYTSSEGWIHDGTTVITVWNLLHPRRSFELTTMFMTKWIHSELFHPSRQEILFCPNPFEIAVFGCSDTWWGKRLLWRRNLTGSIVTVTYSPCGNYILSSHEAPSNVHIFRATTLEQLHTISGIGHAPLRFCDEKNELCVVGPDPHDRLHLINFKAERRRVGF
jgi:hypothetical protein